MDAGQVQVQEPGMDPAVIVGEVDACVRRLQNAPIVDPKKEFASNVYPLLRLMAETMGLRMASMSERLMLAENVIADYLTNEESMIRAELAEHLVTALALGQTLCTKVTALPDVPDEIKKMCAGYLTLSASAMAEIANVTLEEDDGEGDDDDAQDEEG